MPVEIIDASIPERIPSVRELFQEFAREIKIDLCFQNFAQELRDLPGKYAPPNGRLLLALDSGEPGGCIALRPFAEGICELKRMYVRPKFRGRHVARRLAEAHIEAARLVGYRKVMLDTLLTMHAAIALYRSLGFRDTAEYYHNPLPGVLYMELNL